MTVLASKLRTCQSQMRETGDFNSLDREGQRRTHREKRRKMKKSGVDILRKFLPHPNPGRAFHKNGFVYQSLGRLVEAQGDMCWRKKKEVWKEVSGAQEMSQEVCVCVKDRKSPGCIINSLC